MDPAPPPLLQSLRMYPILFEIPLVGIPLRSFGLMVVLGFLLGSNLMTRWGIAGSLDPEQDGPAYQSIPVWVMVGIVLGARAMYVAVEIARGGPVGQGFTSDPLSVFFIWEGGLVMYGGAFGGILGGWWCCRKHNVPIPHATDLGMVAGMLGLCIGRIGCLLVGDDFGRIVDEAHLGLPFPLVLHVPEVLPEGSLFGSTNAGQVLYATQPWMSLNALGLLLFGRFVLLPRRRYAGQVSAQILLLYSIGRFCIEHFRGDDIRGVWFDGAISTSQLVSVVVFSVTLLYLIVKRGTPDGRPALTPPEA